MEAPPARGYDLHMNVTTQRLLPLWFIQCGMILGPLFFALVVYAFYRECLVNPPLPETGMREVVSILTWVTVSLTTAGSFLVFLTYRFPGSMHWIALRKRSPNGPHLTWETDDTSPEAQLFRNFIGRTILRLALLEAPAMFGLAVCLIGVQTGVLFEQPDIRLNVLPSLFLLIYVCATLPFRDRVLARLEHLKNTQENGLSPQ